MRVTILIAMCFLSSLTTSTAQETGSSSVQTEVIGSFPGAQWTVPMALNNKGQVVGFITSNAPVGFSAFTWTRDGGFQMLLENAVATDINNRGDITGHRYECTRFPWGQSCATRGFLWDAQTGFVDLGDFAPNAINESGDMAGDCIGETAISACALYNGVRRTWTCDLPDCGTTASGINARGDVVGTRSSPDVNDAVFFRRDGTQLVLGEGSADDINDAGVIAGRGGPRSQAVLWTRKDVLEAPGTSVARALNSRGWAVGTTFGSGTPNDAFFWNPAANAVVRLDPEGTGSEAMDINDRSEIVGTTDNLHRAVIWRVDVTR